MTLRYKLTSKLHLNQRKGVISIKHEKIWYECDYCGKDLTAAGFVDSNGYGGIYDDELYGRKTLDICPDCYQKHLAKVKETMLKDNSDMFYVLDIESEKNGLIWERTKDHKVKVKWNGEDTWHRYKIETLIDLCMPLYEKYCITGNGIN